MKNSVLKYFKNLPGSKSDQFNDAFSLYRKCKEKSLSLELYYNRAGYTPANLEALHYDLKKTLHISDSQIKNFVSEVKQVVQSKPNQAPGVDAEITATSAEEVFTKAPDQVKEAIKLRDEFPFLKENTCPDELLILVGKKFNHYDAYVKAHGLLLVHVTQDPEGHDVDTKLSEEEITQLALLAVENFQLNDDIRNELVYYKENEKILGNHPIFTERKLKEAIDALTVEKGTKRIYNLDGYIRRDGNRLAKAKNKEEIDKLTKKVRDWHIELSLIKTKFGFTDEK